jgi:hypothetical protein
MKAQFRNRAIFKAAGWPEGAALLCALAALHCGQGTPATSVATAPPLQLSLSPSNPQIAQSTAQQFTVRGVYQSGHRPDLTQAVRFTVAAPDGSSVPMAADGLLQLEQPGRYAVSAEYQGRSVTTMITVTAARLTSLALTPKAPKVAKGLTQAFTATAGFSDGTSQDVTASATWSAKDVVGTGIVLLSSKGVATAKNIGQASITARYKTFSATTTLQVTAATLSTLKISPLKPTVSVSDALTFSAQGTFSDGSVQDVTAVADWGVTDLVGSGVASISGSTVVADAVGQATVSAFYQGVEADTILTVAAVTLTSLAISPLDPAVKKGSSQQFAATGTYSNGTTQDLTAMVTWTTTDIAPAVGVATINKLGLATANQAGKARVTASYPGFSATTTLTVTARPGSWVAQTSGSTNNLIDVWGSDVNNIWAVADNSPMVLKWNGTSWATVTGGGTQLQGVWGASATNVWAVGQSGTILHWNGTAWATQASGTTSWLFGIWGSSANDVWAVGTDGTILHWNGTAWATQASGTTSSLDRVWGSDANNVWVVAGDGTIRYWNGAVWASQASGTTEILTGLWGVSASNVWATGTGGVILHWDGTAWSRQPSGITSQIVRVGGTDPSSVWAVGYGGTILKWSGTDWVAQTSGTTNILTAAWGSDSDNVWVVGYNGTILRWQT